MSVVPVTMAATLPGSKAMSFLLTVISVIEALA